MAGTTERSIAESEGVPDAQRRPEAWQEALVALEASLGHRFADRALLVRALTHTSWSGDAGDGEAHNERLEFLGDSVLGWSVAHWLFARYPEADEGTLSRLKARLVSAATLAEAGEALGLGAYLRMGRGERASGGRTKLNVLADAVEALFGAVCLDAGIEVARDMVLRVLDTQLAGATPEGAMDYKTRLQEWTQGRGEGLPFYEVVSCEGPPHAPQYRVRIRVAEVVVGEGLGASKKAAQQVAARQAWERLTCATAPRDGTKPDAPIGAARDDRGPEA